MNTLEFVDNSYSDMLEELEKDVPVSIPTLQRSGWMSVQEYRPNSAGLPEPVRTRRIFVGYFGRTCPQNNVMEVTQ